MKHVIETELARQADGGVIVEIGVGRGNGLKALWAGTSLGRRLPIYGIDPFLEYHDPLGGSYGPECKGETLEAIEPFKHRVTLVERPAQEAAQGWRSPVALLWLDLSMPYDQLREIISLWWPHVIPGGIVAVTGLEYGNLGTRQVMQELSVAACRPVMTDQDKVAVLRRVPPYRGVFWIVGGDGGRYAREARQSLASVRRNLPGVESWLFTLDKEERGEDFDHCHHLPAKRGPFWYVDAVRYFCRAVDTMVACGQILALDSDTHLCVDCQDIWHLLNRYDLALGQSADRDCIDSMLGAPPGFTTPQVGVVLFNNNPAVRGLLADWLARFEGHAEFYGNNDQAPLRDALWENAAGVKWMTLPPEYCLRFDFGAWVVGKVRVLHGRKGGISTDRESLADVANEINSTTRMRVWNHGLVGESK